MSAMNARDLYQVCVGPWSRVVPVGESGCLYVERSLSHWRHEAPDTVYMHVTAQRVHTVYRHHGPVRSLREQGPSGRTGRENSARREAREGGGREKRGLGGGRTWGQDLEEGGRRRGTRPRGSGKQQERRGLNFKFKA
eukprot:3084261-Rhodomonas_salina.1